ncbi:sirohydrochlorin chelatase [Agromyces mariniharenae]|uniref:Cobalamin biosynthesis protein CbiX n=1 Tax=Agromyces mariniharenae TaxID=2604423 RepID=A0A5S4V3T0_9MICO|nr:CbiX/SirB N-terminal domain-containing protein [Agromyces mariniharenae]TYL53674.1 cobalamin biosynthesis protein CbiX [Agromyces mariniharenae]
MAQRTPALVGISHGTSSPEGQRAVRGLRDAVTEAVGQRHPDAPPSVRLGHVDVEQPDVPATLASLDGGEPAVVVPLLLSAGYHVYVDLTEAVADETTRAVVLSGALGPDDRLATLLLRRLEEAGLRDDDRIVLAVAGSSDRRAVEDCRDQAARLAAASGREISLGFLSAAEPRLPDAVAAARAAAGEGAGGRVVVANYLLAPGYFDDLARAAGADVTAQPLLLPDGAAPTELVDVVLDRYAEAAATLERAGGQAR